jgi:hypothetical protein
MTPRRRNAPRHYTPIDDILSELDNVEKELGSLLLAAGPQLKSLATPLSRDEPFPLKSAISAAHLLHSRLSSVTSKASLVRKRKTNISDCLSAILEELMKSNTLWNKEMKRLARRLSPLTRQVCVPQTGFSRLLIALSSSPF